MNIEPTITSSYTFTILDVIMITIIIVVTINSPIYSASIKISYSV